MSVIRGNSEASASGEFFAVWPSSELPCASQLDPHTQVSDRLAYRAEIRSDGDPPPGGA